MRRMLVALLLALSGVVLTQMPAHACTCVTNNTMGHIKDASTVLLGTVESKAKQAKTLTYTVSVERVYKGNADTTVTLRSPATKNACALDDLVADRRYVIFGSQQGEVVEVNSCGGTAPPTEQLLGAVRGVLGAGTSPDSPTDTEPVTAVFTKVASTEPATFTRMAAPGAALVIIGLLGLLLVRRLGRVR